MDKPVLVTGAAGFIGFHLSRRLLREGVSVVGIDNLNAYYDVGLKKERLKILENIPGFRFLKIDITDPRALESLFMKFRFERVLHLAAQAGVRYSLINPQAYGESNLTGFLNILERCRKAEVGHLIYASSSSVYGAGAPIPFTENTPLGEAASLYAATKRANEEMARVYAALHRLPATGLRFFTVFGPWGRPDMALFLFTAALLEGNPVPLFDGGKSKRDFTYIDDAVEGVWRIFQKPRFPANGVPHNIYNIGFGEPVEVLSLISLLEQITGKKGERKHLPPQAGEVFETFADGRKFARDHGPISKTPFAEGIRAFVEWYQKFYR